MNSVWVLFTLCPCGGWFIEPHGPTDDCECWEFVDGVFSTVEKAQDYVLTKLGIPDGQILEWDAPQFDSGRKTIWSKQVGEDEPLFYHIDEYELDVGDWDLMTKLILAETVYESRN